MSTITTERLTKILSETQEVISECNARGVHGSVEVNARLFENVLMELLRHRAAILQGADCNSLVIPDDSTCKYCGGSGSFRWQQTYNWMPCPCKGCTELAALREVKDTDGR